MKSKTLGIYFDELLTEANGICKDDSEECMTIRLAAVDLVARWLVKRSLFFDKLLSEIVSLNLASLQGERARCVEVKEVRPVHARFISVSGFLDRTRTASASYLLLCSQKRMHPVVSHMYFSFRKLEGCLSNSTFCPIIKLLVYIC